MLESLESRMGRQTVSLSVSLVSMRQKNRDDADASRPDIFRSRKRN